MAAGATKTYTALFQIGGKLLGSFKGAMQMAEARLKRLRAVTAGIGGAFKGLTGVLASFAGGLAGFGIGKVFSSMFSGAVEEAIDAQKRFKTIQVTMLKNAQLMKQAGGDRAKALVLAKEQTELITKHNDALAEQGVLSDDVFNSMARQMSVAGVPTKSILRSVGAMGDLLVAINGVTASEEEGAALADNMMKAIFQGKTKGLTPWLGAMPKTWWKDQIKMGHGYQDMLDDLLQRMEFAKGTNAAEALTPLGKIQRYNNHLRQMKEDIGGKMIPMQAKMAEMWDKALPEIEPAIMFVFKGMMLVMRKLSQVVVQYVMPAMKRLQAWWNTQTPEAQKRWLLIAAAIGAVGAAVLALLAVFPLLVGVIAAVISPVGATVAAVIAGIIATIAGMVVFWHFAGDAITAAASATWDFIKAGWRVVADAFMAVWNAVSPELKAIWADIKVIISVFWDWLKVAAQAGIDAMLAIWHTVEPYVLPIFDKIKVAWQFIVDAFNKAKPAIIDTFKAIGKVFVDWLLEPLKKFRWLFDKVAAGINAIRPGGGAAGGGGAGGVKAVSQAAAPFVGAPLGMGGPLAGLAAGAAPISKGASAAAGRLGGGVPVTVASYGGPTEPGQTIGAYNNRLGPGDVAISPNLYSQFGAPGPGNYVMLDGQRYHVADASFYTPGNPTSNMVEIWGYGNQIKRAGTLAKAYRRGGIAAASQLAMLGEGGPEAVIPLSGGARAEGLLNYAANALGMATPTHTTSVSFSPSIVINGNATEAEQRAMDSRLRDLKDDFIKQFERAQRQERRLSYEGGYA